MAITLIALGSNRCHGRHGRPAGVLRAALAELALQAPVVRVSPLFDTAPIGPGSRRYANAIALIDWAGTPASLLGVLKAMERGFGRRPGQRWGDRVLDLDIIACGRLKLHTRRLTVPHPYLAQRRFVLDPLAAIAPDWRHPANNLTAKQLRARLLRPKGLPRT